MAILEGPLFATASQRDATWLEAGLSLLVKERRADGLHDHPPRLFELMSELHGLAEPTAFRGTQPNATDLVASESGFDSLSVDETAKRLDVSGAMVRRRCQDESLIALKVGGRWRIHPESVRQLEAK
jgi:excisionase family DNA binding protein